VQPIKITMLGTGTSQGVPVIGCTCETCTSQDKKDKRLRSSVLITVGDKNILIDAGPDFRQQMLTFGVLHLDAILLTHEHNDHIIGMDDIRPFNFRQGKEMPVYGLTRVLDDVKAKFGYIFETCPYPGSPRIMCHEILPNNDYEIFPGLNIHTIHVMHGNLPILGYKIGNFAYITDASYLDECAMKTLKGLDILVLNALQYRKHYSHFTYAEALEIGQQLEVKSLYLTHMSHEMGCHKLLEAKCPEHVFPAYDGLVLECGTDF